MRCRTGPGQEPPPEQQTEKGAISLPCCSAGVCSRNADGQSRFAFASLCACKAFLLKKKKKKKNTKKGLSTRAAEWRGPCRRQATASPGL